MLCHPSADAMKQVLHFRGQDNQILRSSSVFPLSSANSTHLGVRPRPVQVCSGKSELRYFGATFARGLRISIISSSLYPMDWAVFSNSCRACARARAFSYWVALGAKNRQGFAGLTCLSKEFHGQPEAQILGSVRLILRFWPRTKEVYRRPSILLLFNPSRQKFKCGSI